MHAHNDLVQRSVKHLYDNILDSSCAELAGSVGFGEAKQFANFSGTLITSYQIQDRDNVFTLEADASIPKLKAMSGEVLVEGGGAKGTG